MDDWQDQIGTAPSQQGFERTLDGGITGLGAGTEDNKEVSTTVASTPPCLTTPTKKDTTPLLEHYTKDTPLHAYEAGDRGSNSHSPLQRNVIETTIAYSRPKNLRDLLTSAKLREVEGRGVSTFFQPTNPTDLLDG